MRAVCGGLGGQQDQVYTSILETMELESPLVLGRRTLM